jgi:hypothetical protein
MELRVAEGSPGDESVIVRGVIDLAASPDPAVRAQVWRKVRTLRERAFIPALVAASRSEPDDEVRREAVATLAIGFPADEGVRAALAASARDDWAPLVRAVAQRGLADEAAWKETTVSVLKDASLPAAARAEAMMFYMFGVGPMLVSPAPDTRQVLEELDDQTIQTLAGALVSHRADDSRAHLALVQGGDPRVRATLEKISRQDPDATQRERAALMILSVPH